MAKVSIVLQATEEFKEALAQYAQDAGLSSGEVIRRFTATGIGYNLSDEVAVARKRKYANKAERDKEMRARAKRRHAAERELIAAVERGEREETIKALLASIKQPTAE